MTEAVDEELPVPARLVLDAEARPRARSAALLVGVLFVACVGSGTAVAAISEPTPTLGITPNLPVERTVPMEGSAIVVSAARAAGAHRRTDGPVAGRNRPLSHRISEP